MDLYSLKYGDLQQLAKSVGLKANMKAEKLLKALKQHFEQQESSENANNVDAQAEDEVKSSNVTKRRRKSLSMKRKHSDQGGTDNEPKVEVSPAQDNAELNDSEEGRRSSKRRKVSSTKGTESPAVAEDPKESQAEANPKSVDVTQQAAQGVEKKTAGRIPRHEGLLKKTKAPLRPTTPNFKKLHEAHFNKMESIVSYIQRKNRQMDAVRSSVTELKAQSENSAKKPGDAKIQAKPPASRAPLFSPGLLERKPTSEKRRFTPILVNRSAAKNSVPFRPAVLSVNKINVRFSEATQDNEHKRSLVKTPARMSPMVPLTPTPGRKSDVRAKPEINKNAAPVNKTPGVTPFVFSGATPTPSTNKKNTFDLKASLSRPLTYKPHTGKLKSFVETKENTALNKSQTIPSHQKNYKQHQVQTREERRIKHTQGRRQKKETVLDSRRGLVMT